MNPFDSVTTLLFVVGLASTAGLKLVRNRTSTLVIQKYYIAVEPQPSPNPTVEIVGRAQGAVALVLSLIGLSPIIRFTIAGSELRCQSTSLFGQRLQFIPLRCVTTMAAGIHKPIGMLIWAAVSVVSGLYMSLEMRAWTPIGVSLFSALVMVVLYVMSKKFFIEVYAQGGPSISLLFKPNLLEGVPLDVDQALAVVDVIRDLILREGSGTRPQEPPSVPRYVEAPYEASAWASSNAKSDDDDDEQARQLFAQARQYAQDGDRQRAVFTLQEIVRRFPQTETADQARRNLQKRGT